MQLSKEVIEEYEKIYKETFGEEISNKEAREQGTRLINLFRVLLGKEKEDKENIKNSN